MAKKTSAKKASEDISDQKKPTTPEALREISRILGRFKNELEEVATLMEKQNKKQINIRGRAAIDMLFVRLNGYLGNAYDACGVLSVLKEAKQSYHVEETREP